MASPHIKKLRLARKVLQSLEDDSGLLAELSESEILEWVLKSDVVRKALILNLSENARFLYETTAAEKI